MLYYPVPFWLYTGGSIFLKLYFKSLCLSNILSKWDTRQSTHPKCLIEVIHFISLSFISNGGSFDGILSFSWALWRSAYLVLSLFRDNLFVLKHFKTTFRSKLAVWKNSFIFLSEKKSFASTANISGSIFQIHYINYLHILSKEVALKLILEVLHR